MAIIDLETFEAKDYRAVIAMLVRKLGGEVIVSLKENEGDDTGRLVLNFDPDKMELTITDVSDRNN